MKKSVFFGLFVAGVMTFGSCGGNKQQAAADDEDTTTGRKLLADENAETEYAIDFFPSCKSTTYTPNFLNDNTTKAKLGVNLSIKY